MGDDFKVGKDDRNKGKRSKIRHYKKVSGHIAPSPEPPQSIIDVADSSDDSYFKRTKACNWSRYEEDTEGDFTENEQMSAADFEALQSQPCQPGSRFTFSSEKGWEEDTETTKTLNISYFNLNLSLLNAGLQTIPFYKRMDYGELHFPKHKIKEMDEMAENAELLYKDLLKSAEEEILKSMQDDGSRKSSAKSSKEKSKPTRPETKDITVDPPSQVQDAKDDELDKLLSMTEEDMCKLSTEEKPLESPQAAVVENDEKTESGIFQDEGSGTGVEAGNKEDIQQWLDDILND